jgi:S-adenosylmethionine hydrolase
MSPLITLTTDFGLGSPYVAQIKGVILSICRNADLIDLTHAIAPQNIREGAVVLADTTGSFPPGTIHLAVVDPGVGTARRLIYAQIGGQRFVTPDNGLVSLIARRTLPERIIAIENPAWWLPNPSRTFHGRDILAPVAAHLACGVDPAELGPPSDRLVSLDCARPVKSGANIRGEILYVDSFGNLITNITREEISALGDLARVVIDCAGRTIFGLVPTYGAARPGEVVALFDSQDRLEIAVACGNAARQLGAQAGAVVHVSGSL